MKLSVTLLILLASTCLTSSAHASLTAYLSPDGLADGVSPFAAENLPYPSIDISVGGTGELNLWVLTSADVAGISLNLSEAGGAIKFTGSTVHNPSSGSGNRWWNGLVDHGDVTDSKVSHLEGAALVGLPGTGQGIGPSTELDDAMFETGAGFLFATIDYEVVDSLATSWASLEIGRNIIGFVSSPTDVFLGVGDGPVARIAGEGGITADALLTNLAPDVDGSIPEASAIATWTILLVATGILQALYRAPSPCRRTP